MLQQTQVERVIPKYKEFISAFPNLRSLADAPLKKVLTVWQGMGYNRRAIALQQIASKVLADSPGGIIPSSAPELAELPGIGIPTASAICAFAYHKPVVFIETNIRRVFIYFFFPGRDDVHDREIMPLVEMTLDTVDPRKWYYALMDYGSMLRQVESNPNRRSIHYKKQSSFHGSRRQLRGRIIKVLLSGGTLSESAIAKTVTAPLKDVKDVLNELKDEGFIVRKGRRYSIL